MKIPKFDQLMREIFTNRAPDIAYPLQDSITPGEILIGTIDDPIAQSLYNFGQHCEQLRKVAEREHRENHLLGECNPDQCLATAWQERRLRKQGSVLTFLFWSYVIEKFPEISCLGGACGIKKNWQVIGMRTGKPLFGADSPSRKFFETVKAIILDETKLPLDELNFIPLDKDEVVLGKVESETPKQLYCLRRNINSNFRTELGIPISVEQDDIEQWLDMQTVADAKVMSAKANRLYDQTSCLDNIFWEYVFELVPRANDIDISTIGLRQDWTVVDAIDSEIELDLLRRFLGRDEES